MKGLRLSAVAAVVTVLLGTASAAADPALPSDPNSQGTIGLCNRAGQPVTSGSVTDKPFVWRAVGSQAAASPYDGNGTSATLYGYQPRSGVPADQWSGDTLTASSAYTNRYHPMAQATQLDFTLQDLLNEYPALEDGLIQLRLTVGAGQVGAAPDYATAFVQVDGAHWTLVSGSSGFSCGDGSATSSEVEAGIVDKDGQAIGTAAASLSASAAAASAAARSSGGHPSGSGGTGPSRTSPSAAGSTPGSANGQPCRAAPAATASGSGGVVLWTVLAVVVVAALGGVLWWRRRSAAHGAG